MPTYTFNLTEQQQITNAFNQGPATIGLPGNHVQLYSTVSTILSTDTGGGAPDSNAEVKPVRIWFDGATKVNSGEGVFSTLIREYTHTQGELHWNRRFTDFDSLTTVSEIQEASNQVARNAQESLLDNSWTLQTINNIADNDANGVGEVLFDFQSGDTVNSESPMNPDGQNAAWSGTLLFSSFDNPDNPDVTVDETGRLISTGNSTTQADSLDDWRNVLYAHHSYNTALLEAGLEGA